jgi:hypothetical protein
LFLSLDNFGQWLDRRLSMQGTHNLSMRCAPAADTNGRRESHKLVDTFTFRTRIRGHTVRVKRRASVHFTIRKLNAHAATIMPRIHRFRFFIENQPYLLRVYASYF